MRPILLKGHERPLTQLKFNREGDILFSTAKDDKVSIWYAHNGERLGTYSKHNGAMWTVDVNSSTTLVATGGAGNSLHFWRPENGEQLFTIPFSTAVKIVEFSPDDKYLFVVIEEQMGQKGRFLVFDVPSDVSKNNENLKFSSEPLFSIPTQEGKGKVTTGGWTYDGKHIITGHENGYVSKWDALTGDLIEQVEVHERANKEKNDRSATITDLQFSPDRTYFITSSKDKSAKLIDVDTLNILKTYTADSAVNTAAITPVKDFIILGGGQEAREVTTTSSRQGKFESRFYHKVFEDEIGRVKGHFGPINTIAVHPDGTAYASGGEDGYIRIHHFDKSYFDFMYDVERETPMAH